MLTTIVAFLFGIVLLVLFHEFGHYAVARWHGVHVLRFSVGFGRVLWSRMDRHGTEWVISAIPLGGYVRMLDEREGDVPATLRHRTFNALSVGRRMSVIVAGPLANLLLAVFLYWLVFLQGVHEPRPVFGVPQAGSAAAAAGWQAGERVRLLAGQPVVTQSDFRWHMMEAVLNGGRVELEVEDGQGRIHSRWLSVDGVDLSSEQVDPVAALGFTPWVPVLPPVIGQVLPGSPAEQAGLQPGDEILAIDDQDMLTWPEVVNVIRQAPGKALQLDVRRGGQFLLLTATPKTVREGGAAETGKLGIGPQVSDADRDWRMVMLHYGPLDAAVQATRRTGEMVMTSLRMIGHLLSGAVSPRQISGPVTIADYAGQTAQMGWIPYLKFLAMISISLGVMNLLPVPMLDGGHLVYHTVELVRGRPLSDEALMIGQRIGLAVLAMLMSLAFYNDITRLLAG